MRYTFQIWAVRIVGVIMVLLSLSMKEGFAGMFMGMMLIASSAILSAVVKIMHSVLPQEKVDE